MLHRFAVEPEDDTVMVPIRCTRLDHSALARPRPRPLPLCERRAVDVRKVGAVSSGLLAHDRPRPGLRLTYLPAPVGLLLASALPRLDTPACSAPPAI
ncbi:hypothetical protein [Kitasatospora sp. NPDC004531]